MKFLIVGLGNPGNEYAHTRHNIGFDVVNAFVRKHGGEFTSGRHAWVARVKWKGKQFVCVCPNTYMNLSGKAVNYWLQAGKINVENLLVVTDDIALLFGKLRMKSDGSDGGHNGLKSIIEHLATMQFARLRFGVGNTFAKGKQSDYVLGEWSDEEKAGLQARITVAL